MSSGVQPAGPGAERAASAVVFVDGDAYVPESEKRAVEDELGNLRRTLAMVHMHLVMEGPEVGRERAVTRIRTDTGWGFTDARAIAEVVQWARSEVKE